VSKAEAWRIGAAGAALAAALVGVLAWEGQARASGREVALPMAAVDPRAPLTGHYVALELQQDLEGEACPPGTRADAPTGPFDERGRRRWVALRETPAGWRVAGAADTRAEARRLGGAVTVRGTANCYPGGPGLVELDIGVKRFHAGQREAEAIERRLAERGPGGSARAFALVSVGRDGRARLNGVLIDGRRVELRWW